MANERIQVEFRVKPSNAENCVCSACRNVGRVIKLEVPETIYSGYKLKTNYRQTWLCFNCREKLIDALMWGAEDGK